MPTSITANGKQTYVPGTYGQVVADGLANPGISTGNLAIVGEFPFLQNDTPIRVTSAKALKALDPTSPVLRYLAKLAFSPSLDPRIVGASSVTLVNAQTVTQAYKDLLDADGDKVIKLKSNLWGSRGNSTWFKIESNVTAGKDITITAPGMTTETYKGLGLSTLLHVKLTTGALSDNTELNGASDNAYFGVSDTDVWTLYWSKRLTANVAWNPAPAMVPTGSNKVYIKNDAVEAADITITVTGTGTKVVGGAPVTSAVFTFPKAGGAGVGQNGGWVEIKTAGGDSVVWSQITKVENNSAGTSNLDFKGIPLLFDATRVQKVSDMVTIINNFSAGAYFAATIVDPRAYSLAVTEVDKLAEVTCKNANATMSAEVWAIVQGLAGSQIVTASRYDATGKKVPVNVPGDVLGGATETAIADADYESALVTLENKDVQTVVCLSDSVEVGKYLVAHLTNAAVKFGRERDGVFGCPKDTSLANIKSNYVAKLNSRNVSVYGDKIKIAAQAFGDVATWLDPKYTAVLAAACLCGQAPGQALTRRTVDVLDISHSWTDGTDENDVISGGISALTTNQLGQFMFLRSVTSWIQDNNPAYSEVSANASVNVSIRDLRAYLNPLIGITDPGLDTGSVEAMVKARLAVQRDSYGWIKGFSNVKATLQTDAWSIDYLVDELQPINFILVTEHVKAG